MSFESSSMHQQLPQTQSMIDPAPVLSSGSLSHPTLSFRHHLRNSVVPYTSLCWNETDQCIAAATATSLTVWSLRKVLATKPLSSNSPVVENIMWARKHNVYIVLFGPPKSSKKTSHKHPDGGVVKILHPNLTTLAFFKPHGVKAKDCTKDICYNSKLGHIVTCGGAKEGKICVWDLYDSDEDLSSGSENEEFMPQNTHVVLNISPIAEVANEMGFVSKLKVGVCSGEQVLVALTKNNILLYSQGVQLLKLTGAIEDLHPSSVKITEVELVGGEGKEDNDMLIAGLSDGTITVWSLKPFLGLEIRRSAEIVCSFTAHRTVGSGLGVIQVLAEPSGNMWETPLTAAIGKGEFSFVTIGEDCYVRRWTIEGRRRNIGVWETAGPGDASSVSGHTRETVEEFYLAKEIGTFKLQRAPPNHYLETQKEIRAAKGQELRSLKAGLATIEGPWGKRNVVFSSIGGLISILEAKACDYHVKDSQGKVLDIKLSHSDGNIPGSILTKTEGGGAAIFHLSKPFLEHKVGDIDTKTVEFVDNSIVAGFEDGRLELYGVSSKNGGGNVLLRSTGREVTRICKVGRKRFVVADGGGWVTYFKLTSDGTIKQVSNNQAHAGGVIDMHSTSGADSCHYVATCAAGGVCKVFKATDKSLDIVGYFIAGGDVSCICAVGLGGGDAIVGVGFESGMVEAYRVKDNHKIGGINVDRAPITKGCFHAGKITMMDENHALVGNIMVATGGVDCAVNIFGVDKEGMYPVRRLGVESPVYSVRIMRTKGGNGIDILYGGGSRLGRIVGSRREKIGFKEGTESADDFGFGGESISRVLDTEVEQRMRVRQEAKEARIMKKEVEGENNKQVRASSSASKSPVKDRSVSPTFDRPWSQGGVGAGFGGIESDDTTIDRFVEDGFILDGTKALKPNNRSSSPISASFAPTAISPPSSPPKIVQQGTSQSISLPSLMQVDSNSVVSSNTVGSGDINLSVASVHSGFSQGERGSASRSSRRGTGRRKKEERLPNWSKLRRDVKLKNAFEGNDRYHTGRIKAELMPQILRWWWPDVLNNGNGDNLIAAAMQAVGINFDHNITLAQLAQVAARIVKNQNMAPPKDSGDIMSPVKKRLKKYKEMGGVKTKVVYNEVGEPRRVKVAVEEPGGNPTDSQKRFNQMAKISRRAKSVVPGPKEYVPYQSNVVFEAPSLVSVPSSFHPYWQSPMVLTKTRTLPRPKKDIKDDGEGDVAEINAMSAAPADIPSPEPAPEEASPAPQSALQAMYGGNKNEPIAPPVAKKKRVVVFKPRFMDLNKTIMITRQLLDFKIQADKESNTLQVHPPTTAKVIYAHYLRTFGFPKVAEHRLTQLFDSVAAHAPSSSLLRIFGRILDLYGEVAADAADKSITANLPFDLCDMYLEMLAYCQDRDFIVDGLLVPAEGGGAGGFRGGGKNEVKSQCISKRHMELCFREVSTADGRHFSPGCISSVGAIIFNSVEINLFDKGQSIDQPQVVEEFDLNSSLNSGMGPTGSSYFLGSSISLEEIVNPGSASLVNPSTSNYSDDYDSLIDLEDVLELIVNEVLRFDDLSTEFASRVFGETAVPEKVVRAVSRDITSSRAATRERKEGEEEKSERASFMLTEMDKEGGKVMDADSEGNDVEVFRSEVLRNLLMIRGALAAFTMYDDQRSGCVSVDVFGEVCRSGGAGAWRSWGVPPLYAYALKFQAPPGTPGSRLGTNPLKKIEGHPDDDEPIHPAEVVLQTLSKKFFSPIEGNICYMDFVTFLYAGVLEFGKLGDFEGFIKWVEKPNRGLERSTVDGIVDFMSTMRLIQGHAMFNVQGIAMGESTSLLIQDSAGGEEYILEPGRKKLTMNEGPVEGARRLMDNDEERESPVDPGILSVEVTLPPSRGVIKSAGVRYGSNEEYTATAERKSRGGTADRRENTEDGDVLQSFWSGGDSDFQSLPGGDVVEVGESIHSDFGFTPKEPDDISLGAGAISKRMSSLVERPKTGLHQSDITDGNLDIRRNLHADTDPKPASVSRMLQMSNKVIKEVGSGGGGRRWKLDTTKASGFGLGLDEDMTIGTADSRCQSSPVREFQKNLVRAMSSPGLKRLSGRGRKRKLQRSVGTMRPTTVGGSRKEGTNVYIRFPGVEPAVTSLSMAGSKSLDLQKKLQKKKTINDYIDRGALVDESKIGRYDVLGRPLSPLKGMSQAELEAKRLRLLAEAEARKLRAEREAERLRLLEEERLRKLREEEEAKRRAEEEERRKLMEEKLRLEEEYKRKREEAERLRREELERLEAERLERERLEREEREREEALKRAREEAAAKRRAEEEARKAAILAEKKLRKEAATKVQNSYRSKIAWRIFLMKKKKKEEQDQKKAAVNFQRIRRGQEARRKVAVMKVEKKKEDEKKGAIIMQKVQRGRKARKLYALKLFEKQHKEQTKASVVLQSKIRQREAKKEVARVREKKRKFKKEEMAREAKERKRMGKCDFDADKVGWDLGEDRWGLLNRPLTYAELQQQEMVIRSRGKVVEKNLVRLAGKVDDGSTLLKQQRWYGSDIEFDATKTEVRLNGDTGVDLEEGEERETGIEDEYPQVLKDAQMRVPSDLSFLYDLAANYDHLEWPPVFLTDKWDWPTHMVGVEEKLGVGVAKPEKEARKNAVYRSGRIAREILMKDMEVDGRSLDELSYYSTTRYPIIPLIGERKRIVVGVGKGEFVYMQIPIVEKDCTVSIVLTDYEDHEHPEMSNFDLYVSEDRLPTYYTYDLKPTNVPRRVTLFPNNRPILNEKNEGLGNLFVGIFSENGGKCLVNVHVTTEVLEKSSSMEVVSEKVEFLGMLSENSVGELVSKFDEISKFTMKNVKRNNSERAEFRATGRVKSHESMKRMLEEGDSDDYSASSFEGIGGSEIVEEEEYKAYLEEKRRREIAVSGLVGVYTGGIKVSAVDLDGEESIVKETDEEGEYYVVPEGVSRGKVVVEERREEKKLGNDIDLFDFDEIMKYVKIDEAKKKVARERKYRASMRVAEKAKRIEGLHEESTVSSVGGKLLGEIREEIGGEEKKELEGDDGEGRGEEGGAGVAAERKDFVKGLENTFEMWMGVGEEGRPGTGGRPGTVGAMRRGRGREGGSRGGKRPGTSEGRLMMKGDIDFNLLKPLEYKITKMKGIEKSYAMKKDRRADGL